VPQAPLEWRWPVTIRFIAAVVTASAVGAVSCGCSPHADKVAQKTAQITLDGNTHTSHAVSCTQVEWLLTVDISAAPARVKMVLNLEHGKPQARSVDFDNVNGFTGVAGNDTGSVHAEFARDTYTVSGAAQGTNPNDVNHPRTADFRISAKC
jgi:ipoprotein LpqH